MIYTFSTYIEHIKEGLLKTTDGDLTVSKSSIFLNPLKINYNTLYNANNNIISLEINNFNKILPISQVFDCIESFFVNMNGWFPSKMDILHISGMKNSIAYNRKYLMDNCIYFQSVKIQFESKFDIPISVPKKLYHLSIMQFFNQIKKSGLFPKDKSKLTIHPGRIYLCDSIENCKLLIPQMKIFYSSLTWNNRNANINDKWVIYEIDNLDSNIKLYQDPNYKNGYYTVDNISPGFIKLIEME